MRAAALLASVLALGLEAPALAQPATVSVPALGQTVPVGTAAADAADDPAIWRNPRKPEASLIAATDKKAGLYVYGLDGAVRHFQPSGRLNNVDLVDMGRAGLIVVASDRNDEAHARLQIYRLETSTGALIPLGSVAGGAGEAYGLCLYRQGARLQAFSVLKHGLIEQVEIDLSQATPSAKTLRRLKLATQTEGCVVDRRQHKLYVGEEARGIWQFDARASGSEGGKLVAAVDGKQLVADVEGLALMPSGRKGGWLIASSQGDNAYALYRLPGMQPAGRFRIAGGAIGSTEETDGIELARGSFGPGYPGGLFVAQDGVNAPHAQNFKLVSWQAIVRALRESAKR